MASENTVEKKVTGGCHCGNIKYTAAIPVDPKTSATTATRCNCTFCTKLSATNRHIPPANFTLVSPASLETLGNYRPKVKTVHRYFCQDCGTHVWMEGFFEFGGQKHDIFAINLSTVDQPQEGVDLSGTKLRYYDMLHYNVAGGLKDEPWAGGLP